MQQPLLERGSSFHLFSFEFVLFFFFFNLFSSIGFVFAFFTIFVLGRHTMTRLVDEENERDFFQKTKENLTKSKNVSVGIC